MNPISLLLYITKNNFFTEMIKVYQFYSLYGCIFVKEKKLGRDSKKTALDKDFAYQ